jgi:hypothetical protein
MTGVNPRKGLLPAWIAGVQSAAWPTLIAAFALTLACLWYVAGNLGIDTSTTDMISEEVPFRQNDARFDRLFPQFTDSVVVVIDAPTPEDATLAAERLGAALAADEAHFREVYTPGSEPIFSQAGMLYLSLETLYDLSDRLVAAQPLLGILARDPTLSGLTGVLDQAMAQPQLLAEGEAATALSDLLLRMAIVAEAQAENRPLALSWQALVTGEAGMLSAGRRFLMLRPVLQPGALQPAAAALESLDAHVDALGLTLREGIRVRSTGPVVLDHQELESVQIGGSTAGILSLVLVAVLLGFGLRSARLVIATVATLIVGLIWTAAFAAFAVGSLNLISVAFAVLFIGLGVDFGIHSCLRFREEARAAHSREARARAVPQAFAAAGPGIALSAICAAAGFFAFLPTDYLGLAELGAIAGAGMIVALVATFTVLPALMSVITPGPIGPPRAGGGRRLPRLPTGATLGAAALLTVAAGAATPTGEFDFDPINLKDPAFESVRTFFELAQDPETTPYQLNVLVEGAGQAEIAALELRVLPEVGSVRRLQDFVPEGQDDKLTVLDDLALVIQPLLLAEPDRSAVPPAEASRAFAQLRRTAAAARELPAPLGAAAERLTAALDVLAARETEPGPDLDDRMMRHFPAALRRLQTAVSVVDPIAESDLPAELRERWQTGDVHRLEIRPAGAIADNVELRRFAEAVLAVAPQATGAPVIISGAADAILEAFVIATAIAFAGVLLILAVTLRRPMEIALVTATLLLAALWTAGAAALFDISFNFANIIALPLLFGLGVASAIHFVLRLREEGNGEAVLRSSTSSGVLFSALTTIAAFGSLAVSGHRGMSSMGQLLMLAIAITLVATLVVLPAMIEALQRRRRRKAAE